MDGAKPNPISASEFYAAIGTAKASLVAWTNEDACPPGKSGALTPPEGLVGFSQRLCLRDADILEQVQVVALGNLAQRPALARPGEPSADCRARAGDEPADRRFRLREDAGGDTPGEQRAGIWYGHARAPNLVPGQAWPDRMEPDQ